MEKLQQKWPFFLTQLLYRTCDFKSSKRELNMVPAQTDTPLEKWTVRSSTEQSDMLQKWNTPSESWRNHKYVVVYWRNLCALVTLTLWHNHNTVFHFVGQGGWTHSMRQTLSPPASHVASRSESCYLSCQRDVRDHRWFLKKKKDRVKLCDTI